MGCTQLGARAMFHRAKKSMARLLNSHGIDKSVLPVALLIFGKLSATSEAAAAGVSITAATLHVGPWAAIRGLRDAARDAGGAAGSGDPRDRRSSRAPAGAPGNRPSSWRRSRRPGRFRRRRSCWYYYPPAAADTVMIRTGGRAIAYSQWLQKEQANYYRQGNRITIRNHRQFAPIFRSGGCPRTLPACGASCGPGTGRMLTWITWPPARAGCWWRWRRPMRAGDGRRP